MNIKQRIFNGFSAVLMFAILAGCGGGGGEGGAPAVPPAVPQTATFTMNWSAPTTDAGGGALTGLAGYNVYYGTSARTGSDPKVCTLCGYTQKVNVGNVTTRALTLTRGTYYFAVTAYDASGNESVFTSPEVSATK